MTIEYTQLPTPVPVRAANSQNPAELARIVRRLTIPEPVTLTRGKHDLTPPQSPVKYKVTVHKDGTARITTIRRQLLTIAEMPANGSIGLIMTRPPGERTFLVHGILEHTPGPSPSPQRESVPTRRTFRKRR